MTVRLVVVISVRPGLAHRQEEAFRRLAPLVRQEDGCIQYDMHRIEGDEDTFVLLEQWESQRALDHHDVAPHVVAQDALNEEFRAGPARVMRFATEPIA